MFIIIPLIIIFLFSSYIYLNNPSMGIKISIYIFEIILVWISFTIYKKMKDFLD